jgi:hypothetical protein
MKTCILAVTAWLMALPLFLKIVQIIVAPERWWFGTLPKALEGVCLFALPIGLAVLALRRIKKPGSNLKGAAWANWALAMAIFGIVTVLLRFSTWDPRFGGQVP